MEKKVQPKKRKTVLPVQIESEPEESEDSQEEDSESEESDGDSQGEEESEPEDRQEDSKAQKEAAAAAKKSKKSTKSSTHHAIRKCVVGNGCNYEGPNLKRHLINIHVKRKHIENNQVERYLALGMDNTSNRGPPRKTKAGKKMKGRWKHWCPQPHCHYLGPYLPEHLQNKHQMKPGSSIYKTSLKIAVRFKGLKEELEQDMGKTSPPAPQTPPSFADSDEDAVPPSPRYVTCKVSGKSKVSVPVPSAAKHGQSEKSSTDDDVVPPTPTKVTKKVSRTSKVSAPAPSAAEHGQSEQSSGEPSEVNPSDDDDSEYPMAEDYFKEKNPKSNRHKWLRNFYRYLFTPAAGFHKERNRLQHACQVKCLLEESDPDGDDIAFLAQEEGSKLWVDWVIPNLKKKKPGTLKSYLTSFELFLEYVTKKGSWPHLPKLDTEVFNQLFDLGNSLKKWRQCITKETSSEKWDRYLDESQHLLTTTDVDYMLTSKPAVDGRAALVAADQADDIASLSIAQYVEAHDFLIVTLTRAVGTRPSALENATLKMFENAKWDDQKLRKVMLVSSHKRQEDRPAPIPMSADTEYLLKIFITKLRPLVTEEEGPSSKIFLKADGAPFQKGTIGR